MMRMKAGMGLVLGAVLACGGCPTGVPTVEGPPRVRIMTSMGEFLIELDQEQAPNTVQNFLQYVDEGFYDGTIFHCVIPGFVVQGGGYLPGMQPKQAGSPIQSEANNGLKNLRRTVGMARGDDPNSATSQFYINLVDNASLDATLTSPGYTVFGSVVTGMDVVDQIGAVPTQEQGDFSDVPVTDVVIQSMIVEPGGPVPSPQWDAYLKEYQYSIETGLRNVLVDLLGSLISGT